MPLEILDTIQGTSFAQIEVAMDTFRRYGLHLDQYKILVAHESASQVIVFIGNDDEPNAERSVGIQSGSNRELTSKELGALMSKSGKLTVEDSIQGANFRPIHTAACIFQHHGMDLSNYTIKLMRMGDTISVMFRDKDGKRGMRGQSGERPEFAVDLDTNVNVLKSHFMR